MKKSSPKYVLFVFGFLLAVSVFVPVFAQEKGFDVKNTEAILISVAGAGRFEEEPQPKGDEALLITDKTEIAGFIRLFDGNRQTMHACGYNWRITFVRRGSREPVDVWFNEKCEEFERYTAEICDIVQSKFSQIRKSPTHFITEIGIDVKVSPEEAFGKLKANRNERVFALGDSDRRFPFVEIEPLSAIEIPENGGARRSVEAEIEAQKKIETFFSEESNRLAQKYSILKKGKFRPRTSTFGKNIEETYAMKIFFPVGTKLAGIENNLVASRVIAKDEPKVYFLQLVSANRYSDSAAERLTAKFPFIKQTFAYASDPR